MEHFGLLGSFVSFEQCRSIFPWLVPLVSDRWVWHNGKHPPSESVLMTCLYAGRGCAWNFISPDQKHYQYLGSDTSSVRNSFARYSDVVLLGLKWRPRETSAFFSGYVNMFNEIVKQCFIIKAILALSKACVQGSSHNPLLNGIHSIENQLMLTQS